MNRFADTTGAVTDHYGSNQRAWLAKYLGISPIVVLIIVFFFIPLLYLLRISFLANKDLAPTASLIGDYGLNQYIMLITDRFFYEMLGNSLMISVFTSILTLMLSYPAAWYLANAGGWERTIVSAICLLPLFVNIVVSVFGWNVLLLPYGVLQQFLSSVGLITGPLTIFRGATGLILVLSYESLPYAILILVASIQGIHPDKINAARTLGASSIRIFMTIAAPLSMPGIIASMILVFSLSISSYLIPTLVSGSRVVVLPLQIFSTTVEIMDWPNASAMSISLLMIVFGLTYGFTVMTSRATRRGQWSMV